MSTKKNMTDREFVTDIIDGPGGLKDWEDREYGSLSTNACVAGALWTLRCLANPLCEGSEEALQAILEKRKGEKA